MCVPLGKWYLNFRKQNLSPLCLCRGRAVHSPQVLCYLPVSKTKKKDFAFPALTAGGEANTWGSVKSVMWIHLLLYPGWSCWELSSVINLCLGSVQESSLSTVAPWCPDYLNLRLLKGQQLWGSLSSDISLIIVRFDYQRLHNDFLFSLWNLIIDHIRKQPHLGWLCCKITSII